MLLANMAVAHQVYRSAPKLALLRRHAPPQSRLMEALQELCDHLGLNIDMSSAGALHVSHKKTAVMMMMINVPYYTASSSRYLVMSGLACNQGRNSVVKVLVLQHVDTGEKFCELECVLDLFIHVSFQIKSLYM